MNTPEEFPGQFSVLDDAVLKAAERWVQCVEDGVSTDHAADDLIDAVFRKRETTWPPCVECLQPATYRLHRSGREEADYCDLHQPFIEKLAQPGEATA